MSTPVNTLPLSKTKSFCIPDPYQNVTDPEHCKKDMTVYLNFLFVDTDTDSRSEEESDAEPEEGNRGRYRYQRRKNRKVVDLKSSLNPENYILME
jgi:hypothetical protein